MVIEYSKRAPLREAVAQTFDGAHPCSLCHAVAAGKKSEKKSDLQSTMFKIDLICVARPVKLMPPFVSFEYPVLVFHSTDSDDSPPVPPPRAQLS